LLALQESLQAFGLAGGGAGGRRQGRVHLAFRRALLDHQVQVPVAGGHVAELVDFRQFHAGVELHDRKRHLAEERLAHQPQEDVAVLADRPQESETVDLVERLAQDIDALAFQLVEIGHFRNSTVSNR
jgi:hypothetical protein